MYRLRLSCLAASILSNECRLTTLTTWRLCVLAPAACAADRLAPTAVRLPAATTATTGIVTRIIQRRRLVPPPLIVTSHPFLASVPDTRDTSAGPIWFSVLVADHAHAVTATCAGLQQLVAYLAVHIGAKPAAHLVEQPPPLRTRWLAGTRAIAR